MEEVRLVLRNAGKIDPNSIEEYIAAGGYEALKKSRTMDRGELIKTLEETSRLRGRGGAAFPTGKKWSTAYNSKEEEKYLVCNADEGEPGTYKDRTIMENDPHTVIEGMLIGAYATGAKNCIIYVRGEYEQSIRLLRRAAKQAKEKGLCGDVDVRVVSGAGAYVCGEGTAIVNSLDGVRGEPRLKPPSMAVHGLHQKPTIVNNVETFAAVPVIVEKGAEWYGKIGSEKYPGTKLMCISGDAVNKACIEVPTDITLREVVEKFGGGVAGGKKLKAVQLGGSSCGFMKPEQLDTAIDFDSMRAAGASLGSGAVFVISEDRDMADIVRQIAHFFAHESCGKCTPCREGTMRLAEIADKICCGGAMRTDLELAARLDGYMKKSCFCPLGQSAATAFMSALKLFPEDFEMKLQKEAQ